jgi:hypothetical protein
VVDDLTSGPNTASPRARISALLVGAGLVERTVGVDHTLRPAGGRTADVAGHTGTHGLSIHLSALAVGSTWRGVARLRYDRS